MVADGGEVPVARKPESHLSGRDSRRQSGRPEDDGEEHRIEGVAAPVERACGCPRCGAIPAAERGQLRQLVLDALRNVGQAPRGRTVREVRVGPQVLKHTDEVGLAAAVEARDPHGRLRRPVPVADIRVKDALKAVLVLALTDKALELVLEDIPLIGVLGTVDVGDTVVRNLEAQRVPNKQVIVDRHVRSF